MRRAAWEIMTDPKGSEKIRRAEREVGQNIPSEMIGLDTEDVGSEQAPPSKGVPGDAPSTEEEADKSA